MVLGVASAETGSAVVTGSPVQDNTKSMFNTILVIGVGLIGGSLAKAAKHYKLAETLYGADNSDKHLEQALKDKLIDIQVPNDENGFEQFDFTGINLVLVCVPVQHYRSVLEKFLPKLPEDCILCDAGSTKGGVVNLIDELSRSFPKLSKRFVPAHPIAGSDQHGPGAALANLFEDANCKLTPIKSFTEQPCIERVQKFWEGLGSVVKFMSAKEHDKRFAAVSHLPHLLAFEYALAVQANLGGLLPKEDLDVLLFSRIAASSPDMWLGIFQENRNELVNFLGGFLNSLNNLKNAIEKSNLSAIQDLIAPAAAYRQKWRIDERTSKQSPEKNNSTTQNGEQNESSSVPNLLAHAIAYAYVLSMLNLGEKGKQYMQEGGGGFRDFSFLAASPPALLAQNFANNRKRIVIELEKYKQSLERFYRFLLDGDSESIKIELRDASSYRNRWPKPPTAASSQSPPLNPLSS